MGKIWQPYLNYLGPDYSLIIVQGVSQTWICEMGLLMGLKCELST